MRTTRKTCYAYYYVPFTSSYVQLNPYFLNQLIRQPESHARTRKVLLEDHFLFPASLVAQRRLRWYLAVVQTGVDEETIEFESIVFEVTQKRRENLQHATVSSDSRGLKTRYEGHTWNSTSRGPRHNSQGGTSEDSIFFELVHNGSGVSMSGSR